MVVEPLPDVKEDLELAIVTKFIEAIRAEGLSLNAPTRGDKDWPDFETRTANGERIGIEVVEVIDPDHAQKKARQAHYLKELLPHLSDLKPVFDGLVITMVDGYQSPPWPPARSPDGRRLLSHIIERLHEEADDLTRILPGPGSYRRWDFEGLQVGIIAMRGRRLMGSPPNGIDLHFTGTFPTDTSLLARSIAGKLGKSYGSYDRGDLWLLAYADSGLVVDDHVVSCARILLIGADHPFAQVWAFFPISGEPTGVAVQVFP